MSGRLAKKRRKFIREDAARDAETRMRLALVAVMEYAKGLGDRITALEAKCLEGRN